jgi:hypothetical protein
MRRPELAGARLVIDGTGLGRPVLDLLRSSGLDPVAVTITGGRNVTGGRRRLGVPKRDLINAVLLSLEAGKLKIAADIKHADHLRAELMECGRRSAPLEMTDTKPAPGSMMISF